MKICLVTGGAGFIGSNLVRKLLSAGHRVHVLTEKATPLWRLSTILNQIVVHEIDIAHFEKINALVKIIKPEWIFHLASYGGLPEQQDQESVYYINFESTRNLVNACKEIGFECFINTGSSSEYGIKQCQMKEDLFLEPVSDYGIAKAASTHFCLKEALINKLPIYTIRPFSVYGDYEMATRLIPTVLINALTEKPVLLSSPTYVRDFIYVEDIVDMYFAITRHLPRTNFIFNAGSGVQSSIQDIVGTIQSMIETKITVHWNSAEPRPMEPKHWKADNILAQQLLNWHPHYNLSKGLKKSLTWFKNHLDFYAKGTFDHAKKTASAEKATT